MTRLLALPSPFQVVFWFLFFCIYLRATGTLLDSSFKKLQSYRDGAEALHVTVDPSLLQLSRAFSVPLNTGGIRTQKLFSGQIGETWVEPSKQRQPRSVKDASSSSDSYVVTASKYELEDSFDQTFQFSETNGVSVSVLQNVTSNVSKGEIDALFDIYNSLSGPSWKRSENWLNGDPCNTSNPTVLDFSLRSIFPSNNLTSGIVYFNWYLLCLFFAFVFLLYTSSLVSFFFFSPLST